MSSARSLLVAFLLGGLLGVWAGARYQRHMFRRFARQGPDTQRMLRHLTKDLDLDAGQQEAVKAVLEKQRARFVALHEQARSQLEQLRASFRSDLRPLLKPEQQKKFQSLVERWDRRRPRE